MPPAPMPGPPAITSGICGWQHCLRRARARRRAVRRLHPAHGAAKHVSLAARRHGGGADQGGQGGERGGRSGNSAVRLGRP